MMRVLAHPCDNDDRLSLGADAGMPIGRRQCLQRRDKRKVLHHGIFLAQ